MLLNRGCSEAHTDGGKTGCHGVLIATDGECGVNIPEETDHQLAGGKAPGLPFQADPGGCLQGEPVQLLQSLHAGTRADLGYLG